jgi:hypothetical protein
MTQAACEEEKAPVYEFRLQNEPSRTPSFQWALWEILKRLGYPARMMRIDASVHYDALRWSARRFGDSRHCIRATRRGLARMPDARGRMRGRWREGFRHIVRTTLDGFNQRDYLEGKSNKSARNVFFYFSGSTPSTVRYKNWKMYYSVSQHGAAGWIEALVTPHWPLIQNIKRDPFEQFVTADDTKSLLFFGGSLAAPSTAFMYDGLGIMPLGQQLWLMELETYSKYPPLQSPETYNLTEVMQQVKKAHESHPGD